MLGLARCLLKPASLDDISHLLKMHPLAAIGTRLLRARCASMAKYFFDFRAGDVISLDDEGIELVHADAAHGEALDALADAINDATLQGQSDQHFAVDVRDDLGPVFEITAVLGSKILRKQ